MSFFFLKKRFLIQLGVVLAFVLLMSGRGAVMAASETPYYRIGPGDSLTIFVWRNQELSNSVRVRPDGRISIPLVEDLEVTGKTPTELAREVELALGKLIKDPIVTVIVTGFVGEFQAQIRIVGEAAAPKSLPYTENMTLLDVMIAVGGLTEFAAGNRAKILRVKGDAYHVIKVKIRDLLEKGKMGANQALQPGDIIVIPEAWF